MFLNVSCNNCIFWTVSRGQCCGSGAFLTPGRDKYSGSFSQSLVTIVGLKCLNSLLRILTRSLQDCSWILPRLVLYVFQGWPCASRWARHYRNGGSRRRARRWPPTPTSSWRDTGSQSGPARCGLPLPTPKPSSFQHPGTSLAHANTQAQA